MDLSLSRWIELDPVEQDRVLTVARRVAARYRRGRDEAGRRAETKMEFDPRVFLHGFGAELAVSIVLGLPWNEGRRTKPDVGHNVEVRQTSYEDGGLVVKSFDKLDRIFILAVGRFPAYRLAGWIRGVAVLGAVAEARYFAPGEMVAFRPGGSAHASTSGGWIVEQAKLRPMEELQVRVSA